MPIGPDQAPIEKLTEYEQRDLDLAIQHIDEQLKKGEYKVSLSGVPVNYVGGKTVHDPVVKSRFISLWLDDRQKAMVVKAYRDAGWQHIRFTEPWGSSGRQYQVVEFSKGAW